MDDQPMDARLGAQARRLQFLFSKLVKPPKESPFADVELSGREIRLLLALAAQGEMIMTDLASVLEAPLSTVTRMADRLESKGLIERSRSEQDRRIVVVRATGKGKEMQDCFEQHRMDIARRMLEPLSPGEREILLELMAKLVPNGADGHPS